MNRTISSTSETFTVSSGHEAAEQSVPLDTVRALAKAILTDVDVQSAPTVTGAVARRVRAWIHGIVEFHLNEAEKAARLVPQPSERSEPAQPAESGYDETILQGYAVDPFAMTQQERGRRLTDAEIDEWVADQQTPARHGTADIATEIAYELHERIAGDEDGRAMLHGRVPARPADTALREAAQAVLDSCDPFAKYPTLVSPESLGLLQRALAAQPTSSEQDR